MSALDDDADQLIADCALRLAPPRTSLCDADSDTRKALTGRVERSAGRLRTVSQATRAAVDLRRLLLRPARPLGRRSLLARARAARAFCARGYFGAGACVASGVPAWLRASLRVRKRSSSAKSEIARALLAFFFLSF